MEEDHIDGDWNGWKFFSITTEEKNITASSVVTYVKVKLYKDVLYVTRILSFNFLLD